MFWMDPNKCYKAHIVQKSFQTNLMYNNRYVSYIHTHNYCIQPNDNTTLPSNWFGWDTIDLLLGICYIGSHTSKPDMTDLRGCFFPIPICLAKETLVMPWQKKCRAQLKLRSSSSWTVVVRLTSSPIPKAAFFSFSRIRTFLDNRSLSIQLAQMGYPRRICWEDKGDPNRKLYMEKFWIHTAEMLIEGPAGVIGAHAANARINFRA